MGLRRKRRGPSNVRCERDALEQRVHDQGSDDVVTLGYSSLWCDVFGGLYVVDQTGRRYPAGSTSVSGAAKLRQVEASYGRTHK